MKLALSNNFFSFLPIQKGGAVDKLLLFTALSLAAFGLVMVYSASYILSQEKFGDGLYYFNHHLVFLVIGLVCMTVCRFLDYRVWEKIAVPLLGVAYVLMILTQVPGIGHKAGGASRWINLGGLSLQPVEFAKIAVVIMLARLLAKPEQDFDKITTGFFFHLWPSVSMIFLCMLQSDFGSTALVLATTGLMLYLGGVRLKYLAGSALAVIPLLVGAVLVAPYRLARLLTFLDPWADPQGAGFQIVQSFIAFYRGGLFGVGLGNSKAKLFYLPEAHNDFILSVVGEELGFLGIALLSLTLMLLVFRGIRTAAKADSRFSEMLAAGFTILLGFETFWNAAIVLGLFPNKGMNMPFISSGGSSIICALSIVGILLNISAHARREAR
ncbi:MAG: putative lipid II flippase FtsW [Bdellovibrionota bacterium]